MFSRASFLHAVDYVGEIRHKGREREGSFLSGGNAIITKAKSADAKKGGRHSAFSGF